MQVVRRPGVAMPDPRRRRKGMQTLWENAMKPGDIIQWRNDSIMWLNLYESPYHRAPWILRRGKRMHRSPPPARSMALTIDTMLTVVAALRSNEYPSKIVDIMVLTQDCRVGWVIADTGWAVMV